MFGLHRSCGTTICRSEMFNKVTGTTHAHVFRHRLRAAEDNADDNGFNTSVQSCAMGDHSDSSGHVAEEAISSNCRERSGCKILQKTLHVHQCVTKHHHEPCRELLGRVQ